MTTETNSVLNTVKEAFAPVTEAFTKLQNLEVPEAAREFVKKQAETAKVRAADMQAGSEKVTAAITRVVEWTSGDVLAGEASVRGLSARDLARRIAVVRLLQKGSRLMPGLPQREGAARRQPQRRPRCRNPFGVSAPDATPAPDEDDGEDDDADETDPATPAASPEASPVVDEDND